MNARENLVLLKRILEKRGLAYGQKDNTLFFTAKAGGRTWRCSLTAVENGAVLYGEIPRSFKQDRQALLAQANRINRKLADGCLVLSEDKKLHLRVSARFFDALYAQEMLSDLITAQAGLMLFLLEELSFISAT